MSSPVVAERRAVATERAPAGPGLRAEALAQRIALHLETLVPRGRARCVDIGCGDMSVAEAVLAHAPRTYWRCIDVYPFPSAGLQGETRWAKYLQFDGCTVPYPDGHFDVALLCDVLHHTPDDAVRLLAEAARVASWIIVKDRFEHEPYSRSMLRLMDLAGDSAAATSARRLTREGFVRLAGEQGLVIMSLDCGLDLREHAPAARSAMRPESHFMAVLHRE